MKRKVVYNTRGCGIHYGERVVRFGCALSGDPTWGDYKHTLLRHDPILVKLVEDFKDIPGMFERGLEVVEVDEPYRIDDSEGVERVVLARKDKPPIYY